MKHGTGVQGDEVLHPRRRQVLDHLSTLTVPIDPVTPGRIQVFDIVERLPEKPGPDDVPWRSKYFVTGRHSADGNSYRRGEPVPEIEAARQGLLSPGQAPTFRTCSRCAGSGAYSSQKPKGHKPGCRCPGCAPCPRCQGTGREPPS